MTLSVGNYIYKGTIRHRRFTPFDHFFTYPLYMAYFDISKIASDAVEELPRTITN